MAKKLSITFDDNVTPLLKGLPAAIAKAVDDVVGNTSAKLFRRIKDATPRDKGDAAGNWSERSAGEGSREMVNDTPYINVLEYGGYPVVSSKKRKRRAKKKPTRASKKKDSPAKKRSKASASKKKAAKKKTGPTGKTLKRGNAILGGYDPGPRTQRAPSGDPKMRNNVSRQAPSGMVRDQLVKIRAPFVFDLEEALDRALAGDL